MNEKDIVGAVVPLIKIPMSEYGHYRIFFENALKRLQEGVEIKKTVWTRDASIQRFEFTFELAWKVMKLYQNLLPKLKLD